jgi:hypothetical protein
LLVLGATALLGWLTAHTEILYTDGLRYIAQAKTLDRGAWRAGLVRSVDHPVYPLAIVAVHRLKGGHDPSDWQRSAQLAAAGAGVLLVIPIYLIALELFGPSVAWLACLVLYLIPANGHLLADALSESTLLLFWSFGVWSSLRLLRTGRLAWLLPALFASGLAYWTRPEGLVVPVSLVVTLLLSSFSPPREFSAPRMRWALGLLLAGTLIAGGPFMLLKGGISSKPTVQRLLGLAPTARAMAVERERPLDPAQTPARTALLATRAMARAVATATTIPMLMLAPLGIALAWSTGAARRSWLFVGVMLGLTALAMIRMHAVAGYCTPRHAVMVSWILILAGAAGLDRLATLLGNIAARALEDRLTFQQARAAMKAIAVAGCLVGWGPAVVAPIDSGYAGYRLAGRWLAPHTSPGERVIDPKGLALYYAGQPGYTFATLVQGSHDTTVRWVVAHDALMQGPWDYCNLLRNLVGDRRPIEVFPAKRVRGSAQIYVFDLWQPKDEMAGPAQWQSPVRR